MSYNRTELYSACLEIAETTLWDNENTQKHKEVRDLADIYFKTADGFAEDLDLTDLCPDENPIVPAVRYLANTHAIPTMGNYTAWFHPMLSVVLELCCPNAMQTEESSEIFHFFKQGMDRSVQEDIHVEVDQAEKEEIDKQLDLLDPNLKSKRIGAWQTFNSDNPDRLSQSANSMVELLDKVINKLCQDLTFAEFLEQNLENKQEIRLADSMRKFIGNAKSNLHRVNIMIFMKMKEWWKRYLP